MPKSLVEAEAQNMAQRMAAEMREQGMKPEDIKITPDSLRTAAESRVALGLILSEIVRSESLGAKPEQVKALVQEAAQTYEQPEAVVRWHYEKPERLAEFEALAVERNVVTGCSPGRRSTTSRRRSPSSWARVARSGVQSGASRTR